MEGMNLVGLILGSWVFQALLMVLASFHIFIILVGTVQLSK